jgi:hypothetical protein
MKKLKRFLRWPCRRSADTLASVAAPVPPVPGVPSSLSAGSPEVQAPEVPGPAAQATTIQAPEVQESAPGSPRDPRIDATVAQDVLDVGDLLDNYEFRLQLAEALAALPDIEVLAPERGQPFDRSRHRWQVTERTADPGAVETIAYTISAGLADRRGRVLRIARVAVFDVQKED